MKKSASKGVKYDISAATVQIVVSRLYQLKLKYNLGDAAMWDLLAFKESSRSNPEGVSIHKINLIRYGTPTCYKRTAVRTRLLLKLGLLVKSGRYRTTLSDLGFAEMKKIEHITQEDLESLHSLRAPETEKKPAKKKRKPGPKKKKPTPKPKPTQTSASYLLRLQNLARQNAKK